MKDQVAELINKEIRPALQSHGGSIELVDVVDGIVRVKLQGACAGCPASAMTLYHGVQQILMERLPEIKGVERVW